MIKLIIAFCSFFIFFHITPDLVGQHTVTITIKELRSNTGQVILEFSNANGERISGHIQVIFNKQCVIILTNLKPGNYSFKYFHDENMNQKLDTNFIGMPKEGFGFANNAKGKFGTPDLEKTIISVLGDSSFTCTPIYL